MLPPIGVEASPILTALAVSTDLCCAERQPLQGDGWINCGAELVGEGEADRWPTYTTCGTTCGATCGVGLLGGLGCVFLAAGGRSGKRAQAARKARASAAVALASSAMATATLLSLSFARTSPSSAIEAHGHIFLLERRPTALDDNCFMANLSFSWEARRLACSAISHSNSCSSRRATSSLICSTLCMSSEMDASSWALNLVR
mmetsp:Transcript_116542/g.324005  ORF Transcript_116542/g.324005 Transcript_116542/m.324005 type:complete len:203 (-) Transcript_116542:122-730(-)